MNWPDFIKNHFNNGVPLFSFLEMKVSECSLGSATVEIKMKEEYANTYGIVHGGIAALLTDAVLGVSLRTLKYKIVTLEMTTSYLLPGKLTDTFYGSGKVVHQSKKILHGESFIKNQNGETLCMGRGIYYITGEDDGIYK